MDFDVFAKLVIFEDNHLLIVNKPNNILVQGDRTKDISLLEHAKTYIKIKYEKPGDVFLGLVHRLDRPVSGVLIFARTSKALSRLNKQFRDKTIKKSYLAISNFRIHQKSKKLASWLLKNTTKNIVSNHKKEVPGSKFSETEIHLILEDSGTCVYRINPITGRSHQIRVHMASIGAIILGDLKYGARYPLQDKSIALHCHQMTIEHPVKKEPISLIASLPKREHWKKISSKLK